MGFHFENVLTTICFNFEAVQKYVQKTHVDLVDLVKSSLTSITILLLCKIGFDTAENEPLIVLR